MNNKLFRNKIKVIWVLIGVVLIGGCSNKGKKDTTYTKEQKTADLQEVVSEVKDEETTTEEFESEDKKIIIQFYDTFNDAYNKMLNDTGESIKNVVDDTRDICEKFESVDDMNSEYGEYYRKIANNPIYSLYKNDYLKNKKLQEYNDSFVRSTYVMILKEIYADIISIELPFEYENFNNVKDTGKKDMNVKTKLDSLYLELKDKNIPITSFGDYYSYPEDERKTYYSKNCNIILFPEVDYISSDNYAFSFSWKIDGIAKKPKKVEIKSDNDSIVIKKDLQTFDLDDEVIGFVCLYGCKQTNKINERFEKFKNMVETSDSIIFIFDDDVSVKFEKKDIDIFNEYAKLFDLVLLLSK